MPEDLSAKVADISIKENEAPPASTAEQNVTPWEVEGAVVDGVQQAIDYNKLIEQFGTRAIDEALLQRFESLTGRKPHVLLRRGTFFSHRYVDGLRSARKVQEKVGCSGTNKEMHSLPCIEN